MTNEPKSRRGTRQLLLGGKLIENVSDYLEGFEFLELEPIMHLAQTNYGTFIYIREFGLIIPKVE